MTAQSHYSFMKQELNEIQWRHFLAMEALRIGHGGINQVMQTSGADWKTIKRGIEEVQQEKLYHPGGRIRQIGGGRKKLSFATPELPALVEKIADPKGDPMRTIRWTTYSLEHIATAVKKLGHTISPMSVYRILKAKGFALKANKKEIEGTSNHRDRNLQFEYINKLGLRMQLLGAIVLSVDAKKTELLGRFKNNGREWQPKGSNELVNVHDFGEKDVDGKRIKAIPYGVYNILKRQGFVNVGIDHNTASFAVESIRRYWESYGKQEYRTKEMMILADGGSSNGAKNRLWKVSLQQLANETGLTIHVCHYPPGTSKWNAIEHELFSFISINWRAKPLVSYEVMLELLNHTTTKAGLTVTAVKDTNLYQTGIKITDKEMATLNIIRDDFHGDWNYTIKPQTP